MIDSSAPAPEPEPLAEPAATPDPEPTPTPVVDEDPLEPELAAQVIDIPDGDKLVPLSALTKTRAALKEAKRSVADAPNLKQQLADAQAQAAALAPFAHAFQALQQAQHGAAPVAQPAPVEDTTELEEIAKDFDFYTPAGQPDLTRARKHQERESKRANAIAQQAVAPLVQHSLTAAARDNIALAKQTKDPATGQPLDPKLIDAIFGRIAQQPNGLATLADRESVKHLWIQARGLSMGAAPPPVPAVEPAPAPPLVTERAGGRQAPHQSALSAAEKRAIKDSGMTEKAYLEIAGKMPW